MITVRVESNRLRVMIDGREPTREEFAWLEEATMMVAPDTRQPMRPQAAAELERALNYVVSRVRI